MKVKTITARDPEDLDKKVNQELTNIEDEVLQGAKMNIVDVQYRTTFHPRVERPYYHGGSGGGSSSAGGGGGGSGGTEIIEPYTEYSAMIIFEPIK